METWGVHIKSHAPFASSLTGSIKLIFICIQQYIFYERTTMYVGFVNSNLDHCLHRNCAALRSSKVSRVGSLHLMDMFSASCSVFLTVLEYEHFIR